MSVLSRKIADFDLEAYIEDNFQDIMYARDGEELRVNCFAPAGCRNSDEKQHLYVNVEQKRWICFKCGYGNSKEHKMSNWLPKFIADNENISVSDAIEKILGHVTPTPEDEVKELILQAFEDEGIEKKSDLLESIELPKYFFPLWQTTHPSRVYQKYAKSRGLSKTDFDLYDVRYSFTMRDRHWYGRIIFPIYSVEGICKSAVGRAVSPKAKIKYCNWRKTELSHCVWPVGYFKSRNWKTYKLPKTVVLTEGIFDALAVIKHTNFFAVCTFGKKLSRKQIQLLKNLGVESVILAYDKEAKKQILSIGQSITDVFDVYLFPFKSKVWNTMDFGTVLEKPTDDIIQLLEDELCAAIPIDSPEIIGWSLR